MIKHLNFELIYYLSMNSITENLNYFNDLDLFTLDYEWYWILMIYANLLVFF